MITVGTLEAARRWQPGDQIVMRDVRNGVVRAATPVTVVQDSAERLVYCVAGGTRFWMRSVGRRTPGYSPDIAPMQEHIWDGPGSLTIRQAADGFAVKAFWRGPLRTFSHWYINLESQLTRTQQGFDRLDYVLDVIIAPDLETWTWKDEDEFDVAIAEGRITIDSAQEIRAAGLRAVEMARRGDPPFNEGWEHWQPDPAWPIPVLPEGWDVA